MRIKKYLLMAMFFLISMVSFSIPNKEVLTKSEVAEIRKVSTQNADKLNSYITVLTTLQEAALGNYSGNYTQNFTDGNRNFKVPTEKSIENFVKVYEAYASKYKKLDEALDIAKSKISAKPSLKRLDNYTNNFIIDMKAESEKMKEMYKYYKNKEYKNDRFAKGKILNNQYFKAISSSSDNFLLFYNALRAVLND